MRLCSEASAVIPAGESPASRGDPDTAVVISSGGRGDRHAGSLDVKVPDGQETGRIRTGVASKLAGRSKCVNCGSPEMGVLA
jgi:hypothetical protein